MKGNHVYMMDSTRQVSGFNLLGDVYLCKPLGMSPLLTLCSDRLVMVDLIWAAEVFPVLKAGMCNLLSESALGLIKLPVQCMRINQNENLFTFTAENCSG